MSKNVIIDHERLITRFSGWQGKRGKTEQFQLLMPYMNGEIALKLTVERRNNSFRVTQIQIDEDESDPDVNVDEAIVDLASLRWYITDRKNANPTLPPIIDWWEEGRYLIVASLSDVFGLQAPFREQINAEDPGEREIIWWPDLETWENQKEMLKLVPIQTMEINYFTFDEYIKRPDFLELEREILEDVPEEEREEIRAIFLRDEYAHYQRRLRTMLLLARLKNIPAVLKIANTEKAVAYLEKNPNADWSDTTSLFDAMGDYHLEVLYSSGPTKVVRERPTFKASLGFYSHASEYPQIPDFIGVGVYDGPKQVMALAFWINPSGGKKAVVSALDALADELFRMGIREIAYIEDNLPIEVCPVHGHLLLNVPSEWKELD